MNRLVVGMGVSGLAAARCLITGNESFDTYDDRKKRQQLMDELELSGRRHFGPHQPPDCTHYDQIILSPGISMTHPLVVEARRRRVPVLSEIEFAFGRTAGKVIAVTGSNGKSTTASLIHHLLENNGFSSSLCGNIGVPFSACLSSDPEHVHVLEVSSFQLEHIHRFRPHIGILINLSPDHLDRHGSFEAYKQAKYGLFTNQGTGDYALAPPIHVNQLPGQAARLGVPSLLAAINTSFLTVGEHFQLALRQIPLMGRHNRLNTLFACAAVARLGLDAGGTARALVSFKGLEHRLETVGSVDGRIWINDTKATNAHATQAAVNAMDRPYVLILGGSDKGERFDGLDFSSRPPKGIVAYGEMAAKIVEDLAERQPMPIPDFEEACLTAHHLAGPEAAVLLAPACASFDQFPNFKERGRRFKQIFRQLAGGS